MEKQQTQQARLLQCCCVQHR